MIAVDSNLLVYAHREDASWHDKAYDRIAELAEGQSQTLAHSSMGRARGLLLPGLSPLRLTIFASPVLRDELPETVRPLTLEERKRLLSQGAEVLLRDYVTESELTSFTAFDDEDFHAQGWSLAE